MNNDALTLLPARVRQIIYVTLSLVSLGLSATGALYALSPYASPWWVAGALAAVGVVGAPFGVLAAVNVRDPQPAPVVFAQPVDADPGLDWTPGDESEAGL